MSHQKMREIEANPHKYQNRYLDLSPYWQTVKALESQGYTSEEAEEQAAFYELNGALASLPF